MFRSQFASVVLLLASLAAQAARADYLNLFDNGQQVNVLASNNATITLTGSGWGADGAQFSPLQAMTSNFMDFSSSWAADPTIGSSSITINLGALRPVQSINTYVPFTGAADYGFGAVKLETSNDGINWTTQSNTVSNIGTASDINLASAVNAQYLRITPTVANNQGRLILDAMRVMAPAGSLTDTTGHLNLVAGSGGIHGGVTMTTANLNITDVNTTQMVNEGLSPIERQVLYGVHNGSTVTYQFGQLMTFNQIGIFHASGGSPSDPSASFTVQTSADGIHWSTVLVQSGTNGFPINNMDFYGLTPSTGEFVRFTYTGTGTTDDRISDIQLFGGVLVPEPSSVVLWLVSAVFGLGVCWQRRRRA